MANQRLCSIPECGKPHESHGFCTAHAHRYRRHGDPLMGRTPEGEALRFYEDVVLTYEGEECLTWPYAKDQKGYAQLWFRGKVQYVPRLVCEEHEQPPTPSHQAAHSCGKGHLGCVAKSHLSWKTCAENTDDRFKHGTVPRGDDSSWSKLTGRDVLEIRRLSAEGIRQGTIAKQFNISRCTVSDVVRRKSWAHL